jgi:hypothetical protein
MGRPPRAIKRVGVLVRLEPDQWAMIDKAAGDQPRHDWIVKTLLAAAAPQPKAAPKPVAPKKAPAEATAFKSRLKGEWKAP